MRLAFAVTLVITLGSTEIERAQQMARSRESERAQFHRKYLFDLPGDTVTQIEVITEFRRLVMITEDHLRLGDQMFSRGVRAAEAALAPTRGMLTLKAKLRFHPLNTYADLPAVRLALGPPATSNAATAGAPLEVLDTKATGEHSSPFKTRDGHTVRILVGAVIETEIPASRAGLTTRAVGVILEGRELVRTPIDFAGLD